MNELFLYSAGVSLSIIERCPSQKPKYLCIGAMVLCTALLSSCSGGFAVYSVFGTVWNSILFGLFWGFGIIYTLDRLILASIRTHSKPYMDLLAALPRFAMAALLAVVISKPLELYIFKSEIDSELTLLHNQAHLEAKEELDNAPAYRDEIGKLEETNKALRRQIAEARAMSQEAYNAAFVAEQNGTGDRGMVAEKCARAKQLDERLQNITRDCEGQIQMNNTRLSELAHRKTSQLEAADDAQKSADGLLARIHALHSLCSKDSAAAAANAALTLIFVSIEMVPLFVKLMGAFNKRRPYERLLEAEEAGEEAEAEILVKAAEIRIATETAIVRDRERARLDAERTANASIVQSVVDGQLALAQDVVRAWIDQQRDLLQQDPQQFFQTH